MAHLTRAHTQVLVVPSAFPTGFGLGRVDSCTVKLGANPQGKGFLWPSHRGRLILRPAVFFRDQLSIILARSLEQPRPS